jgi:hypothetical protein
MHRVLTTTSEQEDRRLHRSFALPILSFGPIGLGIVLTCIQNSRLALVMKSGKVTLGYKSTLVRIIPLPYQELVLM